MSMFHRGGSGIGEVVRPMIAACPSEAQRASAEARSGDQSARSAEIFFHVFIRGATALLVAVATPAATRVALITVSSN